VELLEVRDRGVKVSVVMPGSVTTHFVIADSQGNVVTSTQTLGMLFGSNPQPMWVFDVQTLQFLAVNEAAVQHYGYSRDEFLRMKISEICLPEDVAHLEAHLAQFPADDQSRSEWRHLLKDGSLIHVDVLRQNVTFRDRAAKLVVLKDITKQKQTEEALQQAERKYRLIFEEALVGLFQTGYAELTAQLRQNAPGEAAHDPNPRAPAGRPTLRSLPAVDRALLRASAVEVNKLEKYVSFLATVASMGPFIGLFGTVVGIMNAFEQIGITGSTSLQSVGGPIAEALVATAAGLGAAIPAVLFYNYLSGRVKLFASEMDDFAMEFLNICERNFT
jgi:PAS domain S-box-containing protein